MNECVTTLVGTAVTDVRQVVTQDGHRLARFRMVIQPGRFDRVAGRWVDGDPSFLTVICWRALAESVAVSINRGDPVVVYGRMRIREWSRDGKQGSSTEVEAFSVGHDLRRGRSVFERTRRPGVSQADRDAAQQPADLAADTAQPESAAA